MFRFVDEIATLFSIYYALEKMYPEKCLLDLFWWEMHLENESHLHSNNISDLKKYSIHILIFHNLLPLQILLQRLYNA